MATGTPSFSNFPGGFSGGVTIRGVPIVQTHPGKVFYVNNSTVLPDGGVGGQDGNTGTYQRPFATLDYAIGKCTAGRGDIIFIMPGHAETITSATTIALDVAGVAIVGLGHGTSRPTFTFTTANTASIHVNAANVSIQNCIFVANFLSIASAFTIASTTAAPNFTISNCKFRDTSAILDFLAAITTTAAISADGLYISGCDIKSDATTKSVAPIQILGTLADCTVVNNKVTQTVAQNNISQFISHAALVMTNLLVKDNLVYSVNTDTATGAILVSTTATTGSGIISGNRIRALDVAAAILVTATAVQYGMFDNLYTGETTLASGFVLPAIATDA